MTSDAEPRTCSQCTRGFGEHSCGDEMKTPLDYAEERFSNGEMFEALGCVIAHLRASAFPSPSPVEPTAERKGQGEYSEHMAQMMRNARQLKEPSEAGEPTYEELERIFDSAVVAERAPNRQHLPGWRALYEAGKAATKCPCVVYYRSPECPIHGKPGKCPACLGHGDSYGNGPGGCMVCRGSGLAQAQPDSAVPRREGVKPQSRTTEGPRLDAPVDCVMGNAARATGTGGTDAKRGELPGDQGAKAGPARPAEVPEPSEPVKGEAGEPTSKVLVGSIGPCDLVWRVK